jgi:MFS transporter, BCD family, chlorophyll transporter
MTGMTLNADRSAQPGLSWLGIVRLGLVQAAIGAMVMLATSVLNRVMVVDYKMAAALPAGLVAWHYAVQLSRPLWGYSSDHSSQRSPWIMAGLGILALGIVLAVDATVMVSGGGALPYLLAMIAFTMIGLGVGMSGTALLALLASRATAQRKPAAAAISWTMMVAGIVVSAAVTSQFLKPFTPEKLAVVSTLVVLAAFCIALIALRGIEARTPPVERTAPSDHHQDFRSTIADIWHDRQARHFTGFVFLSMLAYSMQDLILEPFAGIIFHNSVSESTALAGVQHGGVLVGMIVAGLCGSLFGKERSSHIKLWIIGGCIASAAMLGGLAMAALVGPGWPIKANIFALGLANGVFAVAAVGAMLRLASDGNSGTEGARMGVWGAAQAIAFGLGGLLGAVIVDLLRSSIGSDGTAFEIVFLIEAVLFLVAAFFATSTRLSPRTNVPQQAHQPAKVIKA